MTEKELRKSLNDYLPAAGLLENRREALLAQVRAEGRPAAAPLHLKGENEMSRYGKFRVALVLAAVLLLSVTIAVATGMSGFVNFKGQPVDDPELIYPTIIPTSTPRPGELSDEAWREIVYQATNTAWEYKVDVEYETKYGGKGTGRNVQLHVQSLEEMGSLLDERLPLPEIPEGYTFLSGYVSMDCDADSAYELVHEETIQESVVIRHYAIPEGEAIPTSYDLTLRNDAGDTIHCIVQLWSYGEYYFDVAEEDVVRTPAVPGMDDALLLIKPDMTELTMRRGLDEPVYVLSETWFTSVFQVTEFYVESATTPADVLLSMFGE